LSTSNGKISYFSPQLNRIKTTFELDFYNSNYLFVWYLVNRSKNNSFISFPCDKQPTNKKFHKEEIFWKAISVYFVIFAFKLQNNCKMHNEFLTWVNHRSVGWDCRYPGQNQARILVQIGIDCSLLWLRTRRCRVQSPPWAKSLTPRFALINHFCEMIISVRIDCCAKLD